MSPFAQFAAVAMLAAAPLQAAPQRAAPERATPATHGPVKTAAKSSRHVESCRRAYRNYDTKTDTYRDARGKRQRCTR